MPKFVIYILFACILCGGFFVRIYNNAAVPSGVFCDEASIGYNAYSLLNDGTDEQGNRFPVLFSSYHDTFFRPGVSIYLTAPFVKVFGLQAMSLRAASATIGTLTIAIIFCLTTVLFSSLELGLLSAFFLAISPWHIHMSRIDQEFVYFPFFLSASIVLFIFAVTRKNVSLFLVSMVLFGVTLYTYVPAYFLTPLFVLAMLLLYIKQLPPKRYVLLGVLICTIIAIPLIQGLFNGHTLSRFYEVSESSQGKTTPEYIWQSARTYIDHFSPEFLFVKGDIGYHSHFITRFSVKGFGEVYSFQLPFILLGFIYAFKRNRKGLWLIIIWLVLYPLATSLLTPFADGGGPFASRSIIGVIPFQILSALGFFWAITMIQKRFIQSLIIVPFALCVSLYFLLYLHSYFIEYPLYASDFWGWQYGAKDIVFYFVHHEKDYDQEIMGPEFNAPDTLIKFYAPNNCKKCTVGLPQDIFDAHVHQLFAVTPVYLQQHPEYHMHVVKRIIYPNGNVAFLLGMIKKLDDKISSQ